jgi:hypothetical protein
MTRIRQLIVIGGLLVLLSTTQALADCYHNGRLVPEGTRIGPIVCENGKWVPRP